MKKRIKELSALSMIFALGACGPSPAAENPSADDQTAEEEQQDSGAQEQPAIKNVASWEQGETSIAVYSGDDIGLYTSEPGARYIQVVCPVKNTGTKPLYLKKGDFSASVTDGEIVSASLTHDPDDFSLYIYPTVILPGETAYYRGRAILVSGNEDEVSAEVNINCSDFEESDPDYYAVYQRLEVYGMQLRDQEYGAITVEGTVINNTESDVNMVQAVIVMFDKKNSFLAAAAATLRDGNMDYLTLKAGESEVFTANTDADLPEGVNAAAVDHYDVYVYPHKL